MKPKRRNFTYFYTLDYQVNELIEAYEIIKRNKQKPNYSHFEINDITKYRNYNYNLCIYFNKERG